MQEEIEEQALQSKLLYLNGFLDALSHFHSYFPIGMSFELFAYNYYQGNIENAIQHHSYDLFGEYSNTYEIRLKALNNWEEILKAELDSNFKRQIPVGEVATLDYTENNLTKAIEQKYTNTTRALINLLKNQICSQETEVFLIETNTNGKHYRIVGLDMVFTIAPTKLLVLQLLGND